jgi:spermidine synthase
MPAALLYLLFFCSGVSGLVYQVVWVRELGNVFGATIYSTSLVVAIFMLGLGSGSYLVGRWADRRYLHAPESLLRAYGLVEFLIAGLGLAISLVLPHLDALAALSSSYVVDSAGWFVLSARSYAAQGAIALGLLGPITMLMGGTLTLLIRHRVRADVEHLAGWKIAVLYAVNASGAASGAFLTDFALVPATGLRDTQLVAVALNVIAGAGALLLSPTPARVPARATAASRGRRQKRSPPPQPLATETRASVPRTQNTEHVHVVMWTSLALMLSGFAAMGMEIVWLRHFNLLLGGFRAVFSLVLTIMLAGIGLGALMGGLLDRWTARPADRLMLVQALLAATVLLGLASNSFAGLDVQRHAIEATLAGLSPFGRRLAELWYNARPMLLEVGLPAILMGSSFPLGNAVIQHAERAVGTRAGALYLANTAGAVCGSLVAGFALLPLLGMQASATVLMAAAALAILPLAIATGRRAGMRAALGPALIAAVALVAWLRLPSDYVLQRSQATLSAGERLLAIHEGVTEVVVVTEVPGLGRSLMTNGHAMSSTAPLDQRYMRALAHIPLVSMARPSRVLVIGFGVGNTTEAATLHPSVERVDVVDLSRQILGHAGYFRDVNHDVLRDPRVRIYVNDGRQHLLMQPEAVYDLITLEPPPIAHAGVAALYSREFYELARTRLAPGGYLSQWLPAYQVPPGTSLAMARAFIDVFPQSVLLSGTQGELLLVGTRGAAIDVDPDRLARALEHAPAVLDDLRRIDLGTVKEIVGTFVGSAETLARATRDSQPVSDDRPIQEYGVRAALDSGMSGVPAALVDLPAASAWCPRCFDGDRPAPAAAGLDTYLALLDEAYHAPAGELSAAASRTRPRRILGSAYLGAVLPDTDAVYNVIGVTGLREGRYDEAADAFREALKRRADSADANRNLGTALAAMGRAAEAIPYLRRAVQLAPDNGGAQYELGNLLLGRRDFRQAADCFQVAVRTLPDFASAHNSLGIALASLGELNQAIEQFKQAVALEPGFEEGRHNLASALQRRR